MNKVVKNITEMDEGQTGTIVTISGGKLSSKRLADLGIIPGKEIKVLSKAIFSGPVQTEINGSRLVLGRGLATKIMVEIK